MPIDWADDWNLNYLPDVFGPLFMGGSVEQAIIRTLKLWLPTYIAEINRQLGARVLVDPEDYLFQPSEHNMPAETCQVLVAVPGTVGTPERYTSGDPNSGYAGATRTTFDARVTVFYSGSMDFNEARAVAQAYAAAVTAAIGQHPDLGDFAELTKWMGYKCGAEERSSNLWRTQSLINFNVVLGNAMSPSGGPPEPSVASPTGLVEVTSENVSVVQEEE